MRRVYLFMVACVLITTAVAQPLSEKLHKAVKQLLSDPQMRHAVMGFLVVETVTGKIIYQHNAQVGLAPASTQKIITSAAAFEFLGKSFRYSTQMGYLGRMVNDSLEGSVFCRAAGDPSFGSWRYDSTQSGYILKSFSEALAKAGISTISGGLQFELIDFDELKIPDGWIFEDIGNYYGAGAAAFNWKENQYDLVLESDEKPGGAVRIVSPKEGSSIRLQFNNQLRAGPKGSGDNAYIYLPYTGHQYLLKGTIPAGEKRFTISGAVTDPARYFADELESHLHNAGILPLAKSLRLDTARVRSMPVILLKHYSPPLDTINFHFMRKSINLYGEALVRTIAYKQYGKGETNKGLEWIRDFFAKQNLHKEGMQLKDGSGLSPLNRVSVQSLVQVLQWAKRRPWYASFYYALPSFNGIKMKSGAISGARSFAGYHRNKEGKEYTFAVIINNFSGESAPVIKKLYVILDLLK